MIAKGAALKGTDNFEHYFYAAIMYANADEIDSSFELLAKCIEAGMYDLARWERNNRLKKLQTDERWTNLKSKMKESERKYSNGLTYSILRDELKQMWKKDQELVGRWAEQKKVVSKNTIRLKEIIEEYGWPTRDMIGKDGVWMTWAIVQHSHDLGFQKYCLKLLKTTLASTEPESVFYAELHDRICRKANQKQTFGQAIIEENGIKKFYPIEKESEVDDRRKSIGLEPLKVYANENFVSYKSS
ncbi:MAG: hypothetical protein KI790_12850 [Cyclobacteriaceae bacterium]|nr:hypothetical protein [Cyclobacteriaceae bacterium HetDA_MAG_MS6]